MFIGHFALGLCRQAMGAAGVARRVVRRRGLCRPSVAGVSCAGLEVVRITPGMTVMTPFDFVSYPYSHSLVMLVIWGLLFGWIGSRARP